MLDEIEVNTPRHKKLLKKIREDHADDPGRLSDQGNTRAQGSKRNRSQDDFNTQRSSRGTRPTDGRNGQEIRAGDQRDEQQERIDRGSDSGNRSLDTEDFDAVESHDPIASGIEYSPTAREIERDLTPEQQKEREKELSRQRSQRYRDRRKADESSTSKDSVTLRDDLPIASSRLTTTLHHDTTTKQKEPAKPLTDKEANEKRDKLIFLFVHGSKLGDDVLQIIVKDHEPVSIWQLSEEEAAMFADMQLEKAKKDAKEAKVVRRLVGLYDKLFYAFVFGPRISATVQHVKAHGGVSFK